MKLIYSILVVLMSTTLLQAQVPSKIVSGQIGLDDGSVVVRPAKYKSVIDSLGIKLKQNPKDTTALFQRALFYNLFNSLLSQPNPNDKNALDGLLKAKALIDTAAAHGMKQLKFQVLRAQFCYDLVYRHSNNESGQYSPAQIAERMKLKKLYANLANESYTHLALIDSANSYDYQRLMRSLEL